MISMRVAFVYFHRMEHKAGSLPAGGTNNRFMKKNKKKRQQPRPKKKKQAVTAKQSVGLYENMIKQFKEFGNRFLNILKDKESLNQRIKVQIDRVEEIFKQYDSVQLLGALGLYLLDNVPTSEKYYMSQIAGEELELDEQAEVLVEYGLNFALSMPNEGKLQPTDKIVAELLETLRGLRQCYALYDMPTENDCKQWLTWVIHSETITVRGDGYKEHIEEVFNEMFSPHSHFYESRYGFSLKELDNFLSKIEDRMMCKIASQNSIMGAYKMWERWRKWDEEKYGNVDDMENLMKRDFSKGLFGEFFEENPDVGTVDGENQFLLNQPDDYTQSDKIFWIVPQSDVEQKIMDALSISFGDNASFIAEGEFKGNIMSGYTIFEKPFVKDGDKYLCFTPMIPHRNMFLIAEKLMKQYDAYYQQHFQQNTLPESRDNYVERKVRAVLEKILSNARFESSVHYTSSADGSPRRTELDIIATSDHATYLIEVKAHELTYKDRVGVSGTLHKFEKSAVEGCYQSNRAKQYIQVEGKNDFTNSNGTITVDPQKPIYKIVVTLQHYSTLYGDFDKLLNVGLMKEEYRDTFMVSLFDLMIIADFISDEKEFCDYLDIHNKLYAKHFMFHDEIDVLNGFLNFDLVEKVNKLNGGIIAYGSKEIDEEYSGFPPINAND